jgi:hypothetical protein
LDLYVLGGNLTGQKYRDNVLAPRIVPHFDNHAFSQIEHGDDVMSTVDVLWVVALAFPDGGGV